MKSKIKVLTIVNSLNMGGIEKTLLSCLKHLNPDEIEMTICCYKKGGVLEDDFKNLNIKIISIQKTGLIVLDFIQMFFVLLFGRYDILHSRFGFTSGGFVLAGKLFKKTVFVSFHNSHPSSLQNFKTRKVIYKLLQIHLRIHKWITVNYASKIIGHSKSNLNHNFKNWENDRLFVVLYNGVEFTKLDADNHTCDALNKFIQPNDFTLLHIGSFRIQKNHRLLLTGFKKILEQADNYKLILVGQGSLEGEIKKMVIELAIEKNIFFAGYDNSIKKYFDAADLLVMPSFIEGFGNVLIEAQYCLVPICGSEIPALQESGYSDYHKYYFNPQSEKYFSQKLLMDIDDIKTHQLDQTIFKAKKFVESNFSIEIMAAKLGRLYKLYHRTKSNYGA